VPTLLLAAEFDNVIPRWSTDRLRARFADGVASFSVIPGTDHNTISNSPQYLEALRAAL
jgi:pimeloyl-ACP methyl ester carboxylesterase